MDQGRIRRPRFERGDRDDRVLAVVRENAASLLCIARRHSLCADDAFDAYQRAMEIYLRKIEDIDDATAGAYLRTVVKHEAMALREARQRVLPGEEVDFDSWTALEGDGEERALSFDQVTRAAEALRHCKRDEVTALLLRAEGNSYKQICAATGWTYTKLNRSLSEGRARFLKRYSAIECGEECERIAPLLSAMVDGEATAVQLAEARPHLRNCPGCRATLRALHESQPAIHAVLPAGLLAAEPVDGGLVSRVYESLTELVLRLQSSAEAIGATKMAAVASAAAVAGGGAVAVKHERPPERPALARPAPGATPAPTPTVVASTAGAKPAAPAPVATPAPDSAREPAPRPRPERRRRPRDEFNFEAAAATQPPVQKTPAPDVPAEPKAAPSVRSHEAFGFER